VASTASIKRVDGAGNVIQSYDAPGEDDWFALSLDPNGTSFWSGSFDTGNFYRFNIASGAVEIGPLATGSSALFGLCVKGEITGGTGGGGGGSQEPIPTLTEWGQILMVGLLLACALYALRRRSRVA
jgi:hypothetical protein